MDGNAGGAGLQAVAANGNINPPCIYQEAVNGA